MTDRNILTNPKRWDLVDQGDTALSERPDGDYVRWEDYESFAFEFRRMKTEITQLRGNLSLAEKGLEDTLADNVRLQAENARLNAALRGFLPAGHSAAAEPVKP